MIFAWLTAKTLGIPRGAWVIAAFVFAVAAFLIWNDAREKADDAANVEVGRTIEREGALTETLERTEQGNEARADAEREIAGGRSAELHALCVRTARTPTNCDRYAVPERPAD